MNLTYRGGGYRSLINLAEPVFQIRAGLPDYIDNFRKRQRFCMILELFQLVNSSGGKISVLVLIICPNFTNVGPSSSRATRTLS